MPSGFPRLRALGVLAFGDTEQHEGDHALARDLGGLLAKGLERVLRLPGHRSDRDRFGHALLHEQGRHEMARARARSRGSALGARTRRILRGRCRGKALIGWMLPRREHPLDAAATRPSIVCGFATAWTDSPCSRASRAVTGPMQTTLGVPFTTPSARMNPRTVEALVNVTASTAPERSAVRASAGRERGIRVR